MTREELAKQWTQGGQTDSEPSAEAAKASGNTGLPFGLCKKWNIPVGKDWTPKQAWDALAERNIFPPWSEKGAGQYKDGKLEAHPTLTAAEREKLHKEQERKEKFKQMQKDRHWAGVERFFGAVQKHSNKYFTFKNVHSKDEIVLITDSVKKIKDSYVLVVGKHQAVYLKDWQVEKVHSFNDEFNGYAVKLNRNYFKKYTFSKPFDFWIGEEDDFDSLFAEAVREEKRADPIALGWMENFYKPI